MAKFIISLLLMLVANACFAQSAPPAFLPDEEAPKFKQAAPSSNMDFILPNQVVDEAPVENPTNVPKADLLNESNDSKIDQFFSSTKILDPEEKQPNLEPPKIEEEVAAPAEKPKKKPKKTAKIPDYNFKTVSLPHSIYHRPNSHHNKYLPVAYFKKDWPKLLGVAVKSNNINQLRALKTNGANVVGDDENGVPLLVVAARYGKIQSARWLLMQGYNPNAHDEKGFTALHYAAFSNNYALASLLLSYKASPNLTDDSGFAPAYYARRLRNEKLLARLTPSSY